MTLAAGRAGQQQTAKSQGGVGGQGHGEERSLG
jgi:hypothetical protein